MITTHDSCELTRPTADVAHSGNQTHSARLRAFRRLGAVGFACAVLAAFAPRASAQVTTFEAENLSPVGSGATISTGSDTSASGGVVVYLNSTGTGQTMTLTTP